MIPGFHGFDLIVILIVALLIFGPKRLPEMGASIGKSIKEFRKGMNELATPKEEKTDEGMAPYTMKDIERLSSTNAATTAATPADSTELLRHLQNMQTPQESEASTRVD